jgi:hypothetical protein
VGSGYVFTTAICGVLLRGKTFLMYPTIAALLFIIHVRFFATGWEPAFGLRVQAIGAIIVFSCCTCGNWILRSNEEARRT